MAPRPGTTAHIRAIKPSCASRQLYGLCSKATKALAPAPLKSLGSPYPKIQIPEARAEPEVNPRGLGTAAFRVPFLTQKLPESLGFLKEKNY